MSRDLNLLYPLDWFYGQSGRPLPPVEEVQGCEVPAPFGQLLVGNHDMTPTLEAFHGERIKIRALERAHDERSMKRLVVLNLVGSGRPVEVGAILIHLHLFPDDAKEKVLECRIPLGTILAENHVRHVSCPMAFMQVHPDEFLCEALAMNAPQTLYGRRNLLLTPSDEILADIVEILPPHAI